MDRAGSSSCHPICVQPKGGEQNMRVLLWVLVERRISSWVRLGTC